MASWITVLWICLIKESLVAGNDHRLLKRDESVLKELEKEQSYDKVNRSSVAFQVWNKDTCDDVLHLFTVTSKAISSMNKQIQMKRNTTSRRMSSKIKIMKMLSDELVASERWIFSALHMLKETVKSSASNSLYRILTTAKARLEELQYATLLEEQKLSTLSELVGEIESQESGAADEIEHNLFYDIIKDVLSDVVVAADLLEDSMREQIVPFRNVETVRKINQKEDEGVISTLEDVQGNRYTLSLPADRTQPLTDHSLLFSLFTILVLAGLLSGVCHILHIPTIFGQILAGVLLGPNVLNFIQDPVQVETIGEVGVFLIIFCCGLEISPGSLIKGWRIAVVGTGAIVSLITLVITLFGSLFYISSYQTLFVGCCLSFSSTSLILKYLSEDNSEHITQLRNTMLGMLVLQDLQMSAMMGCLPFFTDSSNHHIVHPYHTPVRKLLALPDEDYDSQELSRILVVIVMVSLAVLGYAYRKFLAGAIRSLSSRPSSKEIETLLPLSLSFGGSLLFGHCGISMELGAFLSGLLVNLVNRGHRTLTLIQPIRDVFCLVFFSTIGLHIYPLFVWSELPLILTLTLFVVSIKYLVCLLVLKPLTNELERYLISAGLAHISEFSIVLGSRGRKLNILTREVYLLIVSITATSLVLSPLIWKVSVFQSRRNTAKLPHKT